MLGIALLVPRGTTTTSSPRRGRRGGADFFPEGERGGDKDLDLALALYKASDISLESLIPS